MLKSSVGIFFNFLNFLLAGNLPPLGCVTIIVQHEGRYLMIERPEGGYVLPGGFMRWKEQPVQTALREGKEETGLTLKVNEFIGYSSTASYGLTRLSTLSVVYSAEVVEGELRNSIEGRVSWLDETDVLEKIIPLQRGIFNNFLHYREQSGQVKRFQVEN
jgi:ADP-ribose pyrophosphatase YjhB (NUDIX family)